MGEVELARATHMFEKRASPALHWQPVTSNFPFAVGFWEDGTSINHAPTADDTRRVTQEILEIPNDAVPPIEGVLQRAISSRRPDSNDCGRVCDATLEPKVESKAPSLSIESFVLP